MIKANYEIGPYKRILLLGGGELLLRLAKWAKESGFDIAVVTAPRHASETIGGATFEQALTTIGTEFVVSEKLDSAVLQRFLIHPSETFSLSLGAAWIFDDTMIKDVFQENLFNLHGTRLPQDRGGGGFSWQILTGNRFGFCNIHKMEAGIDQGAIVFSREFLYPVGCRTPKQYTDIYVERSFEFITQFLLELKKHKKTIEALAQPEYLSSYWPRLNTEINGWIDWRWAPWHLERFICAFDDPYAGAHTLWNDQRIFLKKASVNFQDAHFHPFQAGLVYRKTAGWICIATAGGGLVIEQITDEANADLIGRISVGDRLHTPSHLLDDATRRVVYSPRGIKD